MGLRVCHACAVRGLCDLQPVPRKEPAHSPPASTQTAQGDPQGVRQGLEPVDMRMMEDANKPGLRIGAWRVRMQQRRARR